MVCVLHLENEKKLVLLNKLRTLLRCFEYEGDTISKGAFNSQIIPIIFRKFSEGARWTGLILIIGY